MKKNQSDIASQPRFKGQAAKIREISGEINKAEDFFNKYRNEMAVDPQTAHEFYKRLGGEAQARLTQRRQHLTGKERKQYYPFAERSEANPWGFDMKPEDLINSGYGPNKAMGGEVEEPSLYEALAQTAAGMKNPLHWRELGAGAKRAAKALPSVAESLGRGAVTAIPGIVGDIRDLGDAVAPETMQRFLGQRKAPTTEEYLKMLPRMTKPTEGSDSFEMVGSFAGLPAGLLAAPLKATRGLRARGGLRQATQ